MNQEDQIKAKKISERVTNSFAAANSRRPIFETAEVAYYGGRDTTCHRRRFPSLR